MSAAKTFAVEPSLRELLALTQLLHQMVAQADLSKVEEVLVERQRKIDFLDSVLKVVDLDDAERGKVLSLLKEIARWDETIQKEVQLTLAQEAEKMKLAKGELRALRSFRANLKDLTPAVSRFLDEKS